MTGVAIGQAVHLARADRSDEALRALVRAELDTLLGASPSGPVSQTAAQAQPLAPAQPLSGSEIPSSPDEARTSQTEWIHVPTEDAPPFGHSAYLSLKRGGEVVVERCDAPDYASLVATAESDPYAIPECRIVLDGRISALTQDRIELVERSGESRGLAYRLDGEGPRARLALELETGRYAFVPGRKNTLWEALSSLPSVVRDFEERQAEHHRLRSATHNTGDVPIR